MKIVVSFGSIPIAIADELICLMEAQVGDDGFIRREEELEIGDRVRINSGPFESLVGVFNQRTKDKERVRILLDAINYQSHLLIDKRWLRSLTRLRSAH